MFAPVGLGHSRRFGKELSTITLVDTCFVVSIELSKKRPGTCGSIFLVPFPWNKRGAHLGLAYDNSRTTTWKHDAGGATERERSGALELSSQTLCSFFPLNEHLSTIRFTVSIEMTLVVERKKKINVLRGFCLRSGLFTPLWGTGGGWGSWPPDWAG